MQTFKTLFAGLVLSLGLISCASHEVKTASEDRSEYIVQVEKRLNDHDKQARSVKPETAAQMRAEIADARVGLQAMKQAKIEHWPTLRGDMDSRLIRIQDTYQTGTKTN